jgi:hypothetical protein
LRVWREMPHRRSGEKEGSVKVRDLASGRGFVAFGNCDLSRPTRYFVSIISLTQNVHIFRYQKEVQSLLC